MKSEKNNDNEIMKIENSNDNVKRLLLMEANG